MAFILCNYLICKYILLIRRVGEIVLNYNKSCNFGQFAMGKANRICYNRPATIFVVNTTLVVVCALEYGECCDDNLQFFNNSALLSELNVSRISR